MGDRNFSDPSLSSHTLEKVKKAKVTIETFYSNLVNQHIEREGRMQALERSMNQEGVSEEQVGGKLNKLVELIYFKSFFFVVVDLESKLHVRCDFP